MGDSTVPHAPDARQHARKAVVVLDIPPRFWAFLSRLVIPERGSILRWSGGLRGPQLHLTSAPTFTRRAALRAIAGAASLAAGCGRTASAGTVLRFWAMGREGEVVTELVPEF